jgi:hypothetical protein
MTEACSSFRVLVARRAARTYLVALAAPALAGVALAGCSADAVDVAPSLGVSRSAITSETGRILALLRAGSDGQPGFLLKDVGGPLLENFNETLVYDPASSIKIVVGVGLLQRIDAGASFNLGTTVTHFVELDGSCPTGSGATQRETLGNLLELMLVNSDNAATRTLIDFQGGFAAINATAQSIGMTSTNMNVYPGCNITNRMTQADAARLYEGVANGTLISASSRAALFPRMPADGGDFTGTLAAARAIADDEGNAAGVSAAALAEFESQMALHYKAGNDIWCTPDCLSFYSISGLAEIPTCNGSVQGSTDYAFGLFISGGTNEFDTANTFFSTHAEVLRRPIREALATWESCSAPAGTTGAPCVHNGECHSFVCRNRVCQPASCAPTCNRGAPCGSDADCGSDVCSASGRCSPPQCSPTCSTGAVCGDNGDCSSFVCSSNVCARAHCAPNCNEGAPCGSPADCSSRLCDNGRCARRPRR